MSFFAIEKY